MTILFLTSRVPYPPYRGDKLKIFNLIRELSRRHTIHLVSFFARSEEALAAQHLKPLCRSVRLLRLPPWKSYINCAAGVVRNIPFQVAYYENTSFHQVVEETIEREKPDILHTHLIRMAPYGRRVIGIAKLLDLTDAVSLYLQRFRDAATNPLMRWAAGVEMRRMIEYEKSIDGYDRVLVCSELDRTILRKRTPDATIELLPNGIDLQQFSVHANAVPEDDRIIMTGNMSYFPNADGARWLVQEIFPRVKRAVGNAKLYIVGQNPPASVRKLSAQDVIVTGFVPDIRTEYLKSAVAVSPVRFGAGTLNKVLEPMALGVPVVATSIGMEGLGLEEGRDYLRADDASTFAEAIIALLTDGRRRRTLAASAQQKIRSQFGWHAIALKLEHIYETMLKGGSHG